MSQQQEISPEEIDARIMILINQRNKAMDESVILASKVVMLEKQVSALNETLKQSQDQLKGFLVSRSSDVSQSAGETSH